MSQRLKLSTLTCAMGVLAFSQVGHSSVECNSVIECAEKALASSVPTGAVLAFDLQACPEGWETFVSATGRTIVGVGQAQGLTDRSLRETGGAERQKLDPLNLPPHVHKVYPHAGMII